MGNVLDKIKEIVDNRYGLDSSSKCRETQYVCARTTFFYVVKNFTGYSLNEMASKVNRCRATVLHGIKSEEYLFDQYPEHKTKHIQCINLFKKITLDSNCSSEIDEVVKMYDKIEDLEQRVLKLDLQNKRLVDDISRLSEGNIDSMFSNLINEIPEASKEIVKERLEVIVKSEIAKNARQRHPEKTS